MNTVLITGANRGLGEALYWAYREAGWRSLLVCRNDVPTGFDEANDGVIYGDVTDPWTIDRIAQLAAERGVTTLINNAALYDRHHFSTLDFEECAKLIETNLIGAINVTRACWPAFVVAGHGTVVNINSIAGQAGSAGEAVYCASKHGLAGFSRALQFDGTTDNVRVLNVYFGAMKTGMTADRANRDKLIDPVEAANVILNLTRPYSTLRVTEVTVLRSLY